jgi:hypothetical protein
MKYLQWFWMSAATLLALYIFAIKVVRNLNDWYYDFKMRNKEYPLPPGNMGWPFIGNLWPFYKYFSSNNPDTFINNIVHKSLSFSPSFFIFFLYNTLRMRLKFAKILGAGLACLIK